MNEFVAVMGDYPFEGLFFRRRNVPGLKWEKSPLPSEDKALLDISNSSVAQPSWDVPLACINQHSALGTCTSTDGVRACPPRPHKASTKGNRQAQPLTNGPAAIVPPREQNVAERALAGPSRGPRLKREVRTSTVAGGCHNRGLIRETHQLSELAASGAANRALHHGKLPGMCW